MDVLFLAEIPWVCSHAIVAVGWAGRRNRRRKIQAQKPIPYSTDFRPVFTYRTFTPMAPALNKGLKVPMRHQQKAPGPRSAPFSVFFGPNAPIFEESTEMCVCSWIKVIKNIFIKHQNSRISSVVEQPTADRQVSGSNPEFCFLLTFLNKTCSSSRRAIFFCWAEDSPG